MEAIRHIYPSRNVDDPCETRLDKVNQYHREHGYLEVKKSTVYRALKDPDLWDSIS
jgi:hypothetical protein